MCVCVCVCVLIFVFLFFFAVIDSSQGFLSEWWSIFSDVYAYRKLEHQKEKPETSLQVIFAEREALNLCPFGFKI